ncbi:MAG: HEAT repeat domain-containing protein [Nitrospirae bacterium]|nr:HEAT repeat domain-containing protein [Nitrospirota bacterium]
MPEVSDTKAMIADYVEKGFLENIIDMFRHDKRLYPLIGDLMRDERVRVRLGISALVETLAKEDPANIPVSIPGIAALLEDENATVRGDAAYLLGIIGHRDAISSLAAASDDENRSVRELVREAIEEIEGKIV